MESSAWAVTFPLRSLLYVVTPEETTFSRLEDVPNVVITAIPFFLGFLAIEIAVGSWRGLDIYSVGDILTSAGAGLFSRLPDLFGRSIEVFSYIWIYNNYRLYELPVNSIWTWVFAMLGVDFCYYWFHRASHEINFLWGFHQTHHSSEYFNLSTALRQAIIQKYGSFLFYQPMALFIPPPIAVMHFQLNFLYQFWIHTELIPKLGPLEWIFNTASHHRVHHGRNPYAVDKNYAGFLIIWDRMFGTFEAERDDEPVAFGLIHNVNTFDALIVQFNHFKDVYRKLRLVWYSKRYHGWTRFVNFMKAIFYGPGWFPSKPYLRMGDPKDLPAVDKTTVVRYGTPMPKWLSFYSVIHFLVLVVVFTIAVETTPIEKRGYHDVRALLTVAGVIGSLSTLGFIFDRRRWSSLCEAIRCVVFAFYLVPIFCHLHQLPSLMETNAKLFYATSAAITMFDALLTFRKPSKRDENQKMTTEDKTN